MECLKPVFSSVLCTGCEKTKEMVLETTKHVLTVVKMERWLTASERDKRDRRSMGRDPLAIKKKNLQLKNLESLQAKKGCGVLQFVYITGHRYFWQLSQFPIPTAFKTNLAANSQSYKFYKKLLISI